MPTTHTNPFQRKDQSEIDYQTQRRAKADKILQVLDYFQSNFDHALTLDIGCYDGAMTQRFATRFNQVIGVDIDHAPLKSATAQYAEKNLTFVVYNGAQLPFSDQRFDILIVNHVLYYVKNQRHFLDEIHRVMKADAICYLSVINGTYANIIRWLPNRLRPWLAKTLFGAPVYFGHPVTLRSYKKMLSKFFIDDVTFNVLKNPKSFAADFYGSKRQLLNLISKLPTSVINSLTKWSPVHILVLRPNRSIESQDK